MQESFLSSTKSANIVSEYLVRVQIPTDRVSSVLSATSKASQLKYGHYEQVAFRYNSGTQQFKPAKGSKIGEDELMYVPSDEVSFTVPNNNEASDSVIEAIYESHPYEEPVIYIQETLSTRFKYNSGKDNPNKWWNQPDLKWVPDNHRKQTTS